MGGPSRRTKRPGRARPGEPLALWCAFVIPGVCSGRAQHRHHVLPRSAGGSDRAEHTADVCRPCHEHTHAHPAESYATGRLARRGAA